MMSAAGEWDTWDAIRGSVVARHEWKGLSKVIGLEDWVEKDQSERAERARRRSQRSEVAPTSAGRRASQWHVPGAYE
jgi:DDB1- and CUL4-associated factor 11